MDPEVLRSYMIKLGMQVDTAAFDKMKKMLSDLESVMGKHASSTAMQATKGVGLIVGAYATLMISIGKLIKSTADADMQFQLLGQKMYMSTEAVKAFKQATDTLGHSVQEIAWNAELRSKYFVLVKDIQNLSVPEDAKDMMKQVRGIGFEFDRLKLASKLTLEQVAYNLMRINKGELTDIRTTFGNWVDNVYSKIPEMARRIADFLQPFIQIGGSVIKFFKDMWAEMKPTRDLLGQIVDKVKEFSDGIPPVIKQVGLLAGALGLIFALNSPILIAAGVLVASLALIDDYMKFKDGQESMNALVPIWVALEYVVSKAATAMGFFAIAYSHFIAFMKGEKHESGKTFFQDITDFSVFQEKNLRERWWKIGEKRKESVARNAAIEAGQAAEETGGVIGPIGAQEFGTGGAPSGMSASAGKVSSKLSPELTEYVNEVARKNNVDPNLVFAMMRQESGQSHIGKGGRIITSPKGAQGYMQLMPDTARRLGVDPTDPKQNLEGGIRLMGMLLKKYNGNVDLALAAYNAGEGAVAKYNYTIPPYRETQNYVASIKGSLARGGMGGRTVAGTGGGFGGGGGAPKSATEEVSDVFQQSMGKYPEISRYFDEVTRNSDKAVETASKAVDLSKKTLETADKIYADSKGTKYSGISGFQELLPTSKTSKLAEEIKAGGKSTGRGAIWPFYLDSPRLPNAVEMARFGKYSAESFIGSPLAAAGAGADKLMKSILGKKLYKKYDVASRQLDKTMRETESKVVNQVSIVIHAAAANADEVVEKAHKKFKELTGRDKKRAGVQKKVIAGG